MNTSNEILTVIIAVIVILVFIALFVLVMLIYFNNKKLQELINDKVTFETFFQKAKLNANVHLITGMICGYRIEEIEDKLIKEVRYLDKLVDELAKGRKMEKILRTQ